ncbi:MAG: AraC family transcriptional regulator [Treponema sp.]|jgi:AraC-like DNA-binding protein|nr:AraC family transcriptional regulator [Treponema sp.]
MDYKLTFSGRFFYHCGSGVSRHYHADYQIQLVYSGEAEVHVNDKPYRMEKGVIMLIPKGSSHDFQVTAREGMKTVELKFVTSDPAMEALISQMNILMHDDGTIFNIMSRIVLEGQRQSLYYKEMSNALLMECILTIYRMIRHTSVSVFESSSPDQGETKSNHVDLLDRVDNYIGKNFYKKLSLSDIAAACGYNQDYIYRCIKKKTGFSVIRYINRKKFDRARELIMHTELSLSEIAWNLGFETLQYFSRFFKEYAGISPSEYSKKVRSTIRTDY